MVTLSKHAVAYRRTLFTEFLGVVVIAMSTCGLDWALSFAPTLHFITFAAVSFVETATALAKPPYLKSFLVVLWALASYQLNRVLSTKALLTMQLARWIWVDACSSAARLYLLLDGPSENLFVEWTFDIMRASTHFATTAICIRRQCFFHIATECFRRAVTVSRAYGLPTLGAFVSLSNIFSAWCFIYSKDPGAELIKLRNELSLVESRWLVMRTKAFHNLRIRIRDRFERQHHDKLLKKNLPRFEYTSLESGHIRLLKLKRRSVFSGVIDAELTSCPLQEADSKFEALSYTWGKSKVEKLILINGRPLYVGPNLHSMLHARSMMFAERWIWVDAICINQDPSAIAELNAQLKLMKDIYRKSKRTVGWLGDSYEAVLAVKMIRNIVRTRDMYDQSHDEVFATYLRKTWHPEWQALSQLMRNSYFSRLWVFQEIMLGNDYQLNVGGQYLSFDYMTQALSALRRGGKNTSYLLQNSFVFEPGAGFRRRNDEEQPQTGTGIWAYWSVVHLRRHYGPDFTLPLGYLLSKSASVLHAKYARDKVYGLLAVADGPAAEKMRDKMDCEKSETDIFKDVAVALIQPGYDPGQSSEDVSLLFSHAGIGYEGRSKLLPSWAPDWQNMSNKRDVLNIFEPSREKIDEKRMKASQRLKTNFVDPKTRNYSAGGKSGFKAAVDQSSWTLTMDAVPVDTLHKTGDHFVHGFDTSQLVGWFHKIDEMYTKAEIHIPDGQNKNEVLLANLAGRLCRRRTPCPSHVCGLVHHLEKAVRRQDGRGAASPQVGAGPTPSLGSVCWILPQRLRNWILD